MKKTAAFPQREPACSIRNTKKNGPMVGAFGVNPDGQTCSTRVAALCMTLSGRHSFHPRPVMDRGVLFCFDCNTTGLDGDSGVATGFASGPKARTGRHFSRILYRALPIPRRGVSRPATDRQARPISTGSPGGPSKNRPINAPPCRARRIRIGHDAGIHTWNTGLSRPGRVWR